MLGMLKEQIGDENFAELQKVFGDAESFDEVSAAIFSGECPKCGSAKTETCDEIAGIESPLVGRCKECCTLYCTDCGRIFLNDVVTESAPQCPACSSSNTDFPADDDDDAALREVVECHDCRVVYCFACGGVLPDEPE